MAKQTMGQSYPQAIINNTKFLNNIFTPVDPHAGKKSSILKETLLKTNCHRGYLTPLVHYQPWGIKKILRKTHFIYFLDWKRMKKQNDVDILNCQDNDDLTRGIK